MKTIIICPAYTCIIACFSIYKHLKSLGETCAIYLAKPSLFQFYGIENYITLKNSKDITNFCDSDAVSFISWMHNSEFARQVIGEVVNSFLESSLTRQFQVSFYSDGLNNVYNGINPMDGYLKQISPEISILDFYGFHSNTSKISNTTIIRTDQINSVYDELSQHLSNMPHLVDKTFFDERIVLVAPCRPWCSKEFHGGMYDFGDISDLKRIYLDLVNIALSLPNIATHKSLRDPLILFKAAPGFQEHSRAAYEGLSQSGIETIDVSNCLPNNYQFDIFMYDLLSNANNSSVCMLGLDSTSFYAPLQMNMESNLRSLSCVQGFPEEKLTLLNDGQRFVDKKLKSKIRALLAYYESLIDKIGKSKVNISSKTDTSFVVSPNS